MALDQLRAQIRRAIIPVADLVLDRQPQGALIFPDDIPPVLAILAGSDAKGNPKLIVTNSDGTIGGSSSVEVLDSTGAAITNANPFPVTIISGSTGVSSPQGIELYVNTAIDGIQNTFKTIKPDTTIFTSAGVAIDGSGNITGLPAGVYLWDADWNLGNTNGSDRRLRLYNATGASAIWLLDLNPANIVNDVIHARGVVSIPASITVNIQIYTDSATVTSLLQTYSNFALRRIA